MVLSLRLGQARELVEIRPLTDRDQLARIVNRQRYRAAYALAQLDDDAWEQSQWFGCASSHGDAVVCHSAGGLGDAVTVIGPPQPAAAVLRLQPGPRHAFIIAGPEHLDALQSGHRLANTQTMLRMLLTPDRFQPVDGDTTPLTGPHVHTLNRLYGAEGAPTHYRRAHVEQGWYRGLAVDGRLLAAAGTHAVSRQHRIAILGNVFTHPQHRGHGHATVVTSGVAQALFNDAGMTEIVLSVDPDNTPAVHAYQRLGFQQVDTIIESSAARAAPGLLTAIRRWRARRLGHGQRLLAAL